MDTAEQPRPNGWQPWLEKSEPEYRLAVSLAIVFAMVLQSAFAVIAPMPFLRLVLWLLVGLEVLLLLELVRLNPLKLDNENPHVRKFSWLLTGAMVLGNTTSAVVLDYLILSEREKDNTLLFFGGGGSIFVTNVIAFGLLYWEFDRGGPFARRLRPTDRPHPDFLFPQMAQPGRANHRWRPDFTDYLYVSLTNVTAFSPTDTMPLTRPAKAMMAVQSLVAVSTIALVIARAVNVLG
jgi:hypothetical protein